MKKIQTTLILLLVSLLSCKAQNVVPLDSSEPIYINNSGDYYKDTNNLFNTFEGTWLWEDPATNCSLTVIFKKEENIDSGFGYTYDLLVGEYRYIENGVLLDDSLAAINDPSIIGEDHNITGTNIIKKIP